MHHPLIGGGKNAGGVIVLFQEVACIVALARDVAIHSVAHVQPTAHIDGWRVHRRANNRTAGPVYIAVLVRLAFLTQDVADEAGIGFLVSVGIEQRLKV